MRKIVVALVLVLCVFSCDNGNVSNTNTETNPFVGTWEDEVGARYIFTETTVSSLTPNRDIWWSGTYTYNDTEIIFQWDYRSPQVESEWPNPLVYPYSIENNVLTIFNPYVKVPDNN